MRFGFLSAAVFVSCMAASPLWAQTAERDAQENAGRIASGLQTAAIPDYIAGVSYGHLSRSGDGKKLSSNNLTLSLIERTGAARAQFWTLGGDSSDLRRGSDTFGSRGITASYGQLWGSDTRPGLLYTLSGFAAAGRTDYDTNTPRSDSNTMTFGIIGGLSQAIPVSAKDMFQVGANLSLSYASETGPDDLGLMASVLPFVQYNRMLTPDLTGYVRAGATVSTEDVSLSGENLLFTPRAGLSYRSGDYTLGADYGYEHAGDHRGQRVSLSLSRSF